MIFSRKQRFWGPKIKKHAENCVFLVVVEFCIEIMFIFYGKHINSLRNLKIQVKKHEF